MRLAALAIAGVVILATEKLDVVVVLVEVEIEVAAALRAFQQAGKYAGLLRDRGLFAACPFLKRLHLFPSLAVNDGLMDILIALLGGLGQPICGFLLVAGNLLTSKV